VPILDGGWRGSAGRPEDHRNDACQQSGPASNIIFEPGVLSVYRPDNNIDNACSMLGDLLPLLMISCPITVRFLAF
jgi:hypothetical protein